jgi:hypothetical protein
MRRAKRTARKSSRVSAKSMRRQTKQRRKTTKKKKSKSKKGPTAWNTHMMKVYKEMKAKDSKVKLGDAMKEAGKTYKKSSARPVGSWTVEDVKSKSKKKKGKK